jgi:hypothetical protein
MRALSLLLATVAMGCTTTVTDALGPSGDGGRAEVDVVAALDGARPTADVMCVRPRAVELPAEGVRAWGEVLARFDTRDDDVQDLPFANTACAVRRDRAAVFRYTAEADGALAIFGTGVLEVFADCEGGYRALGCARAASFNATLQQPLWTPPLRVGTSVFIVATDFDTSTGDASVGHAGELSVRTAVPRGRGESCDTRARVRPQRCGPGLVCDEGICVDAPTPPRRCNVTRQDCPAGLRCNGARVCVTPRAMGARCGNGEVCEASLRCVPDVYGQNRCGPPRREGERCVPANGDETCDAGLSCDGDLLVCTRGVEVGGPCETFTCAPGNCPSGRCAPCVRRACVAGAVCVRGTCERPAARPWGVCDGRDPAGCPAGYGCVANRCRPAPVGINEVCEEVSGPGCAPGLVCITGRCTRWQQRGSRCARDADCPAATYCEGGRCGVPGDEGLPCRDTLPRCDGDARCLGGTCVAAGSCEQRALGARCGPGQSCALVPASGCQADGGEGRRCRDGAEARALGLCDAGLMCEGLVCVPRMRSGTGCVVGRRCGDGLRCVSTGVGTRCAPEGSEGALCSSGPWLTCAEGLNCTGGRCQVAHLQRGESCSALAACVPELVCGRQDGRCAPRGTLANHCRFDEPWCDPGLTCVGSTQPTCLRVVSLGGGCLDALCASGSSCTRDGRCVASGSLGARCDGTLACDASLRCVQGFCGTPIVEGEACSTQADCVDGLTCDGGRCVALAAIPVGGMGDRCRSSQPWCDPGLTCDRTTCIAALPLGASCSPSTLCADGLSCVLGALGACRPHGVIGARCRATAPYCDEGAVCFYGQCVATAAPGGECTTAGAACAPGHTCVRVNLQPRCVADGSEGGYCRTNVVEVCDPGLRCNAVDRCVRATGA